MDARLVASRMPGLTMYGAPYTTQPFPGYLAYGSPTGDPSAFYGPVASAGENAEAWRAGLTQAAAAAYYEPQIAAHYGYAGYGPMGLADGARRKNATRETTSTLKAWLNEHRKNPYPTKGEKIMLAIITKMTLTQVSTWFANARRRLKKENKMTWSPRNRCGEDDDDDMMDDGEGNSDPNNTNNHNSSSEKNTKAGETSENSRTSSPVAMTSGSDMPMFDMQHHPFINRPRSLRKEEDSKTLNEDEEIDLESLDEDKKDLIGKSEDSRRPPNDLPLHLRHQHMPPTANGHQLQGKLPFGPHHPQNLLGARGLPLPPHLMTAHQIPLPGNVPKPPLYKQTTSSTSNHQDRKHSCSPASSTASLANSTSSPTKPKIWSLADVATSSDSPRHREPATSSAAPTSPPMPTSNCRNSNMLTNPAFQQEAIRNWVDGVMQQQKQMAMAAAAMAGAHPHGFLPQGAPMMPQNFGGLNPATLAALSRGGADHRNLENKRFHPYGFADFAAAQQRATLAAAHAASMSMHNSGPESPPATYTSTATKVSSIDSARSEKLVSPFASSPVSSTHQTENNAFPSPRPASNDSGIASAEVGKESKHSPK